MSLYDKASLVLIPSGTKAGKVFSQKPTSGDGDFDFTRSSYATRVNSQGLIEKERSNLLLQSNNFDTTWTKADNMLTPVGGQSGYDGSSDAWKIQRSDSSARFIKQTISQSGVQTFSVYAKKGNVDHISLLTNGGSLTKGIFSLPTDGTGTNTFLDSDNITSSITHIGSGWYRVSITLDESVTDVRIYPSETGTTEGGSVSDAFIYIQDAQLEQGLVATDVIETTTSAVYKGITDNVPRLDYDGDCPSLLLEPQRQNLVTQSEYIGATEWVNASPTRNITITETSNTNPEGRAICWKIQGLNTNNQLAYVDSTTIGTTLTNSIYVKRISGTGDVRLRDVNNFHADFSLSVADGWKRIDVTATATSTVARFYLNLTTHNDEILVWGAQQEEGSFATSYIPTYGTSVTRTGDVCDNAGDSTIFNGSEGVLYGEINPIAIKDQSGYFGLLGTTSANRIIIGFPANSNDVTFFVISQGTTIANSSYDIGNMNQYIKVALKYKENDFSLYINGSKVLTDDNGTPNVEISHLGFFGYTTNQPFYGKCKAIAYFNRALTDTELADLTT